MWNMLTALERAREEDREFNASLGYIASSKPTSLT
jgi:hypothetical protein